VPTKLYATHVDVDAENAPCLEELPGSGPTIAACKRRWSKWPPGASQSGGARFVGRNADVDARHARRLGRGASHAVPSRSCLGADDSQESQGMTLDCVQVHWDRPPRVFSHSVCNCTAKTVRWPTQLPILSRSKPAVQTAPSQTIPSTLTSGEFLGPLAASEASFRGSGLLGTIGLNRPAKTGWFTQSGLKRLVRGHHSRMVPLLRQTVLKPDDYNHTTQTAPFQRSSCSRALCRPPC